ncbi:MAG: glycosyltransferase [Nitrospirota bacterium]
MMCNDYNQQRFIFNCQALFHKNEWNKDKVILRIGGAVNSIIEKIVENNKIISVDISSSYINTEYRLDIQADAHSLPMLSDSSIDLVISSHTIEHLTNPLKALLEWKRILKEDGIIYACIPHYQKTFDHKRCVTTLSHLIEDLNNNVGVDDKSHTEEFLMNFDITKDFCFNNFDIWHKNYLSNPQIYTHYHVFDLYIVREMMNYAGFKEIDIFYRDIHIEYFGRKKDNHLLVSIAIPCYEMHGYGVEFLDFSLNKIYEQTYKNIEVVISDHSTDDNIYNLYKKWESFLNLKYLRNENKRGNSSANLNNALINCTGHLIKILFQDDFLFSDNSIKEIVEAFSQNPQASWLVTACEHSNDSIRFYRPFYPQYNRNIYLGNNTISSPSVLTIRNKNILLFDENLIWLMDCDYYKRLHDKYGEPLMLNKINVVNRTWDYQLSKIVNEELRQKEHNYVKEKYQHIILQHNSKIYIVIPFKSETGGPEALHQLSHKFNILGYNCYVAYKESAFGDILCNGKPSSRIYDQYITRETVHIEDQKDNILIVPEVWTQLLDKFSKIRKCIWWLSVDNNLRSSEGKFSNWSDSNIYHLCQSNFAQNYVENNGGRNFYLGEYLNHLFLDRNIRVAHRKNIVLFNPAKGLETTVQIINNCKNNSIEFIPLKGFNTSQLVHLYNMSKVYIDFGNHPGMDRIPRETASNGCCVIVGKIGAANYYNDMPIPEEYKFDFSNINSICSKIKECIDNYDVKIMDFDGYRKFIKNQENKMEEDIGKIFIKKMATIIKGPTPEEEKLLNLLQSDFRNVEALTGLASFELHRSNFKKAKNYLIAALTLEPQNIAAKSLWEKLH